ncbi:hypothetical protein [Nocardia takedensis]|uniref:hypothetical protein n=1 Tax=Nocardia takedensis TaxID=259390 RepID=UPI0002FE8443|nr:hypothetical protein [Nocardia takedensis]
MGANTGTLSPSEQRWVQTRTYLRENRRQLDLAAAAEFPELDRAAGTALLTRPQWMPARAVPLEHIRLELTVAPSSSPTPRSAALPQRASGAMYSDYAEVVGEIAAPAVFENRRTYRLLEADLAGHSPRMRFTTGRYFDSVNIGEAAAHEFADRIQGRATTSGVREAVTDPCDPTQRAINLAISTMTIRRDPASGASEFLLHWRDPRKVGHAGGLYQVVPVGIFQPSGNADWNLDNDFSLWHNIVREFAEELCGVEEDHGSERAPIDYATWDFAAQLTQGRSDGTVRAYCLGLGVDPLTFATDLLTAVVIDAPLFDSVFARVIDSNAEGRVLQWQPFTTAHIRALAGGHPMQAAGAATVELALGLTA